MATIADVAQTGGSVDIHGVARREPDALRLAGDREPGAAGDRPGRLYAEHAGALAEAGLDQQRRAGDVGDLQSVFRRSDLRHREGMREARADGVPVGYRGRSRARSRRSCAPSTTRRVDGIILAPSADPRRGAGADRAAEHPLRPGRPAARSGFDQVGVDNEAAVRALVEHLLAHGHRRDRLCRGAAGPCATTRERVAGVSRRAGGGGRRRCRTTCVEDGCSVTTRRGGGGHRAAARLREPADRGDRRATTSRRSGRCGRWASGGSRCRGTCRWSGSTISNGPTASSRG